jgi:hypothetical protein
MIVEFCTACSVPVDVDDSVLELRAEENGKLRLIGYSCGCVKTGRTRAGWSAFAEQENLTIG